MKQHPLCTDNEYGPTVMGLPIPAGLKQEWAALHSGARQGRHRRLHQRLSPTTLEAGARLNNSRSQRTWMTSDWVRSEANSTYGEKDEHIYLLFEGSVSAQVFEATHLSPLGIENRKLTAATDASVMLGLIR